MKKNERKIEKKIVRALSRACDELIIDATGFCWITHFPDYANSPRSLRIVCVFDTNLALENAYRNGLTKRIQDLVVIELKREDIAVLNVEKAVRFDTEENGANVKDAKWCRHYSQRM